MTMKNGDEWNWGAACGGLMLLSFIMYSSFYAYLRLPKIVYGLLFIGNAVSMTVGLLLLLGLFSLVSRRKAPVLGALLGLAFYGGAFGILATFFIAVLLLSALAPSLEQVWKRLYQFGGMLLFLLAPIACFGYAIWRKPKGNAVPTSASTVLGTRCAASKSGEA